MGAHEDDDKGNESGSAYIFALNNGTWSETQKITASDGDEDDRFGFSASISGDNAILGAYEDDDKGEKSGSAYIFRDSTNTDNTTNISAIKDQNINLYPNPTSSLLSIEGDIEVSSIVITSISGQVIKTIEGDIKNIDASDLPKGAYLLKVTSDKGSVVKQFIRQ